MPKVTLFANSLGHGGSERQAAFIGNGLLERGWEVQMLCVLDRDDYASSELRRRTKVLGKRGRYDLPGVIGRARAALDTSAPLICFNWYPHMVAAFAAPAAPRIVRFGGTPSADGVTGVRKALARHAQRGALAVVGCSWGVVRQAVNELGDPAVACAAIPNAVYLAQAPAEQSESPWPRPYIIAAGRLSPEKDHATLIDAFARVAATVEHDLLIAGDGTHRRQVEAEITKRHMEDRVHLIGYQTDLYRWLSHADLLVHTSRWEGFGIVLIEAMRAGVPVIATDAPYGPRSVLDAVPGGVLVPVGDSAAIGAEIVRLLADDVERARLSQIGVSGVPAAFDPERVLDAYEALLAAACGARR